MQKLILDPNKTNQEILYAILHNAILDGVSYSEDCFKLIKGLPTLSTENQNLVFQQMNDSMIEQFGPDWMPVYNQANSAPTSYPNR